MGEWHDLYLMCDVLLLADVFETYRECMMKTHKLDPAYYFTSPGYTWDAMQLHTGVKLELLQDIDMMQMFEGGIRGGICMVSSQRYCEANNKDLGALYDPTKESNYIIAEDCNNLYGSAMMKPLPHSQFMWEDVNTISCNLQQWSDKLHSDSRGAILKVDLHLPNDKALHDLMMDYPPISEVKEVQSSRLSQWQHAQNDKGIFSVGKKLVSDFEDKIEYTTHISNLLFYLQMGWQLTRIHKVITYHEEAFLKPYIELNTNLRIKASNEGNDFMKELYKLMVNSLFGKTMENVRNRMQVDLVTDKEEMSKIINGSSAQRYQIIHDDMVAVEREKSITFLNKPLYIGFAVLELSKMIMNEFHYGVMKPLYGDRCKLLYTDTDSLIYSIKTEDFYKDINVCGVIEHFDTTGLGKYGLPEINKVVPGKFKYDAGGQITEFVGIRSKMYGYQYIDNKGLLNDKLRIKGIQQAFTKHHAKVDHLVDSVNGFDTEIDTAKFVQIQKKKQQIESVEVEKKCLVNYDSKRWIASDGITQYPYGHYKIAELEPKKKVTIGVKSSPALKV